MSYAMYRGAGPVNAGWRALRPVDQWLVGVIADDHYTDRLGVATIASNRWARTASGVTGEELDESLERLNDTGWVLICDRTYEVWLTQYLVEQQVWKQPNRLRGVTKLAERCSSKLIREAALAQIAGFTSGPGSVIGRRRKPISAELRRAVYERDAWTCQRCGRVIPPTEAEHRAGEKAPYDELGWLELDHKIAHSEGGADTFENLRAACTSCNQSRGAKPLTAGAVA